jgi:hypothetical protein
MSEEPKGANMARYEIVDLDAAPTAPGPMTETTQDPRTILQHLADEKVARILPDQEESCDGIKELIAKDAEQNDLRIEMWDLEGVVYVRLNFPE